MEGLSDEGRHIHDPKQLRIATSIFKNPRGGHIGVDELGCGVCQAAGITRNCARAPNGTSVASLTSEAFVVQATLIADCRTV